MQLFVPKILKWPVFFKDKWKFIKQLSQLSGNLKYFILLKKQVSSTSLIIFSLRSLQLNKNLGLKNSYLHFKCDFNYLSIAILVVPKQF